MKQVRPLARVRDFCKIAGKVEKLSRESSELWKKWILSIHHVCPFDAKRKNYPGKARTKGTSGIDPSMSFFLLTTSRQIGGRACERGGAEHVYTGCLVLARKLTPKLLKLCRHSLSLVMENWDSKKAFFFGKFFPVVLEAQKPFLAVLKFFVYVILTFYYFYVTDVSWSGV